MKSSATKRFIFIAAVLLLLVIVTSPVTMIWLIERQATRIVADSLQGLTTSSLATLSVSEGFLETSAAVNDPDPDHRRASLERLSNTTVQADTQYEAHKPTLLSPGESRLFDRMMRSRNEYRETRNQIVSLLRENKSREARELFQNKCVTQFGVYTHDLGDVVEYNAAEARSRGREITHLCYVLLGIQILLLGFFFVYGFFVPLTAFLERLSRPQAEFRD